MLCSVIYLGFVSIPEFQNPTATFDFFYYHYPHCVHENKIIYKFLIRTCLQELLTAKESPGNVSNKITHCPQEKQKKENPKNPKQNQLNMIQMLSEYVVFFSFCLLAKQVQDLLCK